MKRYLAILLSLVMVTGLFSGLALSEGSGVKEFSIFDIVAWGLDGAALYNSEDKIVEDVVKDAIADATGVKFTKVYNNGGLPTLERLSQMYVADELPDVLTGWGTDFIEFAQMLIEDDILWTFTDEELAALAPNFYAAATSVSYDMLKGAFETDVIPGLIHDWWGVTPGIAKLYPEFAEASMRYGNIRSYWYFRDDILKEFFPDALTFEELDAKAQENGTLTFNDFVVPGLETYDDLKAYLYAVKDTFPDVTPIYGLSTDATLRTFYGFNIFADYDPIHMEIVTGPVDRKDEFNVVAKELNTMFHDGIFDLNYEIDKEEQTREKHANGIFAVAGPDYSIEDLNAWMLQAGKDFRYVPVLIDYDKHIDLKNNYCQFQGGGISYTFFINKKTVNEEDLIKLMAYFDFFATPEGRDLVIWGPEGTGLWEEVDGVRTWVDEDFIGVLKGDLALGSVKDSGYYGIRPGGPATGFDFNRPYFPSLLMNNLRSLSTGLLTDEKPGEALLIKAIEYDDGSKRIITNDNLAKVMMVAADGIFTNLFPSWNGAQPENKYIWDRWEEIKSECAKVVYADPADFDAALADLYVYFDEVVQIEEYAEAMRGYIDWLKENKDIMIFPTGADLDKLN